LLIHSTLFLALSSGSLPAQSATVAVRHDLIGLTPHGGWTYPRGARQDALLTSSNTPEITIDPMAPRGDAPIFRIQEVANAQNVPAVSNMDNKSTSAPVAGGARYYSIHRQAGRQPDAPVLPAPVYLDALPVQLDAIPSGDDLATPPAPPELFRDAQGRLRPVPFSDDFSE